MFALGTKSVKHDQSAYAVYNWRDIALARCKEQLHNDMRKAIGFV